MVRFVYLIESVFINMTYLVWLLTLTSTNRFKLIFICILFMYLLVITFEIPHLYQASKGFVDKSFQQTPKTNLVKRAQKVSGLVLDENAFVGPSKNQNFTEIDELARDAIVLGRKSWEDIVSGKVKIENNMNGTTVECSNSLALSEFEFRKKGGVVFLQCGLGLGSYITVVGRPRKAHMESNPRIGLRRGEGSILVSHFVIELEGLKVVDGEEPPKILHFNPRLKGDWSGKAVIEQNTCYRRQWGASWRCVGIKSKAYEETVDGQVKCEDWKQDDVNLSKKTYTSWWLNRLLGLTKKVSNWTFPFVEDKMFVLTLIAGVEGFHVNVDGRHISSFPYRPGFTLEDATGLSVKGDVIVHSVLAASLPKTRLSFTPQWYLEMVPKWQAPPLFNSPVEIFIGILSAGNHFAERMAVRKSWMQHELIKSSNAVARFFVAMHKKKDVNVLLMKEANFFGDIVIVPYLDSYDLVVLKTLAICEYGVRTVAAKYIMKCDDDTVVRLDAVVQETKKAREEKSLYLGNINYNYKPIRRGKWAVTYEEWPKDVYPPYANGPGYIVSSDIASHVVSEFENHKLRLFKMEDVSMGMWVSEFNESRPVEYIHNFKFCQFGCIEDYITAHYQTPRQITCLWEKLQRRGKPQCCNSR